MALLIEKPWRTQPTGPVTVDWTNPISQGLVFARLGGTQTSVWPRNNFARTGTIIRGSQFGLADGFGSTLGIGSTDVINTNYGTPNTRVSIFARIFVNGVGGGTNNRIVVKPNTHNIYWDSINRRLAFSQTATLQNGFWVTNNETIVSTNWYTIAVTYDLSATSFAPKFYIKGLLTTTIEGFPANGTIANTADTYLVGNTSAGTTNFNGLIAETYIWNRILTPAEVFSIHSNPYQIFRPLELQLNSPPAPRIYYVAGPNATWATPTSTEIINGQLSGGGAATASWSESAPLQSTNPFNFSQPASPLTTGTKYRAAAVQKAGDSNVVSNVVVSDPFLAGAATLSNPEATEITGTSTKPKVTVSY